MTCSQSSSSYQPAAPELPDPLKRIHDRLVSLESPLRVFAGASQPSKTVFGRDSGASLAF